MKNLKLILLTLTTLLFLGVGNVNAQEKKPQTVIIKIYEFAANNNSKIVIIDPQGNIAEIDLKKLLTDNEQNIIPIQKEINKWKSEGFTIEGISGGSLASGIITTIFLSKTDK